MKIEEMKNSDFWEFPEACKKCGHIDNNNPNEPITILNVKTKLCEFCCHEMD